MSDHPLKDEDGNTATHYVARGFLLLCLCLGIGACTLLEKHDPKTPLISITRP